MSAWRRWNRTPDRQGVDAVATGVTMQSVNPHGARDLLRRLAGGDSPHGLSTEFLADAERVFLEAHDTARARWMKLEREGFGSSTGAANLADVLGGASDQIVAAVLRARTQFGRVRVGGVVRQWPHFFVEPVAELQRWELGVGSGGSLMVELLFDPATDSDPRALTFDRRVFTRVLATIAGEIGAALQVVDSAA